MGTGLETLINGSRNAVAETIGITLSQRAEDGNLQSRGSSFAADCHRSASMISIAASCIPLCG